jgi:hypothetical protein
MTGPVRTYLWLLYNPIAWRKFLVCHVTAQPHVIAMVESAILHTRVGKTLAQDVEGFPYKLDKAVLLLQSELGILHMQWECILRVVTNACR